jgi:hypothetical protein
LDGVHVRVDGFSAGIVEKPALLMRDEKRGDKVRKSLIKMGN